MDLVNHNQSRIAEPLPAPPRTVTHALHLVDIVRRGDPAEMKRAGDLTDLPRPWDPASCPEKLRQDLWEWCDRVADWVNHEYAWRPVDMIPACWPRHPHIARELAVLAVLRYTAEQAPDPGPVEEWHRYSLPMFLDRMTARLGESGCRTGKHIDWPAAARHAAFVESSGERRQAIVADTRTVVNLADWA